MLGFTPQICTVPSGSSLQDTCYSQLKRRPSGPCNMWTIQQHIWCLLPYFLWDFKNIFKCCMLWYPEFVLTVQSKNRNNFILDDPIRRDRECTTHWAEAEATTKHTKLPNSCCNLTRSSNLLHLQPRKDNREKYCLPALPSDQKNSPFCGAKRRHIYIG